MIRMVHTMKDSNINQELKWAETKVWNAKVVVEEIEVDYHEIEQRYHRALQELRKAQEERDKLTENKS